MNVKVGCKVRFLNEVGSGQVIKMIDKKTVLVKTDDGFEVPVLIKELVVVEPAADEALVSEQQEKNVQLNKPDRELVFNGISNVDKKEATADIEGEEISLELAFVPLNPSNLQKSDFDLYLINDSTYRVFYVISDVVGGFHHPFSSALLNPDTKIHLKKFTPDDISKLIMFNLQAIYCKNIPFKPYQPEFYDIELDPVKLYKRGNFLENNYFDEDAYIISIASTKRELILKHLTDKAISEAIKQKDKPKVKIKKELVQELEEVDLHIHELVDNWEDLTPGEILKIQLARFETALELGIKSNTTKRMVFIHGVGNGKLKYEITKLLNSKYSKLRYQDASFKEYGFGATMVFVK